MGSGGSVGLFGVPGPYLGFWGQRGFHGVLVGYGLGGVEGIWGSGIFGLWDFWGSGIFGALGSGRLFGIQGRFWGSSAVFGAAPPSPSPNTTPALFPPLYSPKIPQTQNPKNSRETPPSLPPSLPPPVFVSFFGNSFPKIPFFTDLFMPSLHILGIPKLLPAHPKSWDFSREVFLGAFNGILKFFPRFFQDFFLGFPSRGSSCIAKGKKKWEKKAGKWG